MVLLSIRNADSALSSIQSAFGEPVGQTLARVHFQRKSYEATGFITRKVIDGQASKGLQYFCKWSGTVKSQAVRGVAWYMQCILNFRLIQSYLKGVMVQEDVTRSLCSALRTCTVITGMPRYKVWESMCGLAHRFQDNSGLWNYVSLRMTLTFL